MSYDSQKKIEGIYEGWQFGSWRAWTYLHGKWIVRCLKCNGFFKVGNYALLRRKRRPYGCKLCAWGEK